MAGLGTIVNVIAIVVGSLLGLLLKNGIPERYKTTIMQALGLAVMVIGLSGALQGMYVITSSDNLDRQYIMTMILSLVIGALVGEFLQIEDKLEAFGLFMEKKFAKKGNFAEGFVMASLLYCVGSMAILGSLEDGLLHKPDTLYVKSMLDGIGSIVFSSSLGIGVMFSSISVAIYQGSITLLAGFLKPIMTDLMITQISLVGNVLIFAIGINLLDIKKIKVGNLLPAVFIPLVINWIMSFFG